MPTREEAFRRQARSDLRALTVLADGGLPDCHQVHYMQMAGEKLAKAMRTAARQAGAEAPSHVAVAKALRLIRNSRRAARALTRGNREQLHGVIDKCLGLAEELERLAPALASTVNAEYPWPAPSVEGGWQAPCDHRFDVAARLRRPEGRRYVRLLDQVIERFDEVF